MSVSSFVFPVWQQPCSWAEDDSSTRPLPLCDLPTAVGSRPSMSARFVWGAGTPFLAGRDGTECLFRCMMQTQSSRSSHTLRDEACGGSGRPAQASLLPRPMCRTADCAGGMISPSPRQFGQLDNRACGAEQRPQRRKCVSRLALSPATETLEKRGAATGGQVPRQHRLEV